MPERHGLPRSFHVNGQAVPVRVVGRIDHDDGTCWGRTDDGAITLASLTGTGTPIGPDMMCQTALHELAHIIFEMAPALRTLLREPSDEEALVETFTSLLYGALKESLRWTDGDPTTTEDE